MEKKRVFGLIFVIWIILSLVIVSASFKYYNNNIKKGYRSGENIKGEVNLSFSEEAANSILKTNFEGNITLLELLKANDFDEGIEYKCNAEGCSRAFKTGVSLSETDIDGEKLIGFKISGKDIKEIAKLEFKVESDLSESCTNPLIIDILNNGKNILASRSYKDVACSEKLYGCFDKTAEKTSVIVTDSEICETIKVERAAPAYRIGARIIAGLKRDDSLKMIMYDSKGKDVSCVLPNVAQEEHELDCIVESLSLEEEYKVCIENDKYAEDNGAEYKLRSEDKAPVCGTNDRDFEIFVSPLQYDKAIIKVNKTTFENTVSDLWEDYLSKYLKEHYEVNANGNVVCTSGCIIPMRLKGPAQTIKLSEINLRFRDGSLTSEDNKLYNLETIPVTITANPIKIDLEPAKFVIPQGRNDSILRVFLNNELVFSENVSISKSFDFDISPQFALLGLPTRFEIVTGFNVTSSEWDFGDGTIEEIKGKEITHRYVGAKTYDVEVEVVREDGVVAVKTFSVVSGNARESVNKTISDYKIRLSNLTEQIKNQPAWIVNGVLKILDLSKANTSLGKLEKAFLNSSSDDAYSNVMNELLKLNIPISISVSKKGTLPLSVGFENIETSYIDEISGEDESESEELKDAIIGWYDENYKTDVRFEIISGFSEKGKEDLITKFSFDINSKKEVKDDAYLLIDYPLESISFAQNYNQKSVGEGSGAYIPLNKEEVIEFFVPEKVAVDELGAYISTKVDNYVFVKKKLCFPWEENCDKPFPWSRFWLWIGVLVFGVFLIYLILQEWYKKYYERYLFRNSYDLYNLINFIYNSRNGGVSDQEIKKRLKTVGWSGERIVYAFRKLDGVRTGMWEIPLFKGFENRRVKAELAKREGMSSNANFIKQPGF